jgi:hypothetical protein
LLYSYNMEAPAPPGIVLAHLQADVRSPWPRVANITPIILFGSVELYSPRITSPGPEPLYGYVHDDSFEIWIRSPFVKLRGRICASASGSRIVAGVYLEPHAIFAWAFLGLLLALGAEIPLDPRYYSPTSRIPWLTVWFICWLLSSVPLSLMVFATVRRSKSRLAHSIRMAVTEHRLHLDSSALGGPPE